MKIKPMKTALLLGCLFMIFSSQMVFPQQGSRRGHPRHFMSLLDEAQRQELEALVDSLREQEVSRRDIRQAVHAQLDEWGVEVPERPNRGYFMRQLNDTQIEEIEALVETLRSQEANRETIHEAVMAKFDEWGIEPPAFKLPPELQEQLSDEQISELKTLAESMRSKKSKPKDVMEAVRARLESWGLEPPERPHGPRGDVFSRLSDAQKEEMRTLMDAMRDNGSTRREIREAMKNKLDEWGIEPPQSDSPRMNRPSRQRKNLGIKNHPNPFNPETTIHYTLDEDGDVNVTVYNLQGQTIRTLVNNLQQAGDYQVVWNGRDAAGQAVPSGMYICRVTSSGQSITRRMIMMK